MSAYKTSNLTFDVFLLVHAVFLCITVFCGDKIQTRVHSINNVITFSNV